MGLMIRAACMSRPGPEGQQNSNNCCFNGRCMEPDNHGLRHPACYERELKEGEYAALFDGIGPAAGKAAYTAARAFLQQTRDLADYLIPEREYLERLCHGMEEALLATGEGEQGLGTAFAALYFTPRRVYMCSLGDTGVFLARQGIFTRISQIPGASCRSRCSAGYLGAGSAPYMAKGEFQPGDRYLICTDSIIRVMSNLELSGLLQTGEDVDASLKQLLTRARSRNLRDDLAAILLEII